MTIPVSTIIRSFYQAGSRLGSRIIGGYRRGGILGAYHWLRCHLWDRYHVVNFSGEAGYDWGWVDRDRAILLAAFRILRDFVEKEDPGVGSRGFDDYCHCTQNPTCLEMHTILESQVEQEHEVRALYDWWTKQRPAEHARHDAAAETLEWRRAPDWGPVDGEAWRDWKAEEQRLDDKDDEMLLRLAKIRGALWT